MLRERLSGMIAEWRLSMLLAGERISEVMDAQFPSASGIAELRGIVHAPDRPKAGLVIAHGRSNDLGYPLHPRFRREVLNPPEWPYLAKPALFVQGDRDPFCDLDRLRSELTKLKEPADLVVVEHAGHSFEPIGAKRDTFPEVRDAIVRWISGQIV